MEFIRGINSNSLVEDYMKDKFQHPKTIQPINYQLKVKSMLC